MNYLFKRIELLTNSEIKDIEIDTFKEIIESNSSLFFRGSLNFEDISKVKI